MIELPRKAHEWNLTRSARLGQVGDDRMGYPEIEIEVILVSIDAGDERGDDIGAMRLASLLAPCFVLTLAACAQSATVTAPQSPSSTEAPRTAAQVVPSREPTDEELARGPVVTLLDPGQTPRRRVKVVPAIAQKLAIEVQSVLEEHTTLPNMKSPPPVTAETQATLTTHAQAGDVVRCALAAKEPITECSFRRTDQGAVTKVRMLTTDEVTGDSDLAGDGFVNQSTWPSPYRAALRVSSVAFPKDEIGIGARWETWERVRVDHVWARRHATYKLASLGEATATLELSLDEVATEQAIDDFADLREEVDAELEKLKGQLPPGALDGKMVLSPQIQQAMADMRAKQPRLRSAKQHVEGHVHVGFDRALPRSATLTIEGSYDIDRIDFGETGKARRSIVVREER